MGVRTLGLSLWSHVTVANGFANKLRQCKRSTKDKLKECFPMDKLTKLDLTWAEFSTVDVGVHLHR